MSCELRTARPTKPPLIVGSPSRRINTRIAEGTTNDVAGNAAHRRVTIGRDRATQRPRRTIGMTDARRTFTQWPAP